MGIVRFGVPKDLVKWIRDEFKIRTFVETGTNRAETASWAAGVFDRVVSIEAAEPLYSEAKQKFGHLHNVDFRLGDSRTHLRDLASSLREPAIFWLDAHWCGEITFGQHDECPVLDELDALNASSVPHFILVDDARLFLAPPPPPHAADQWPDVATMCKHMAPEGSGRHLVVYEDVIAAVPSHAKAPLVEYLRAQHAVSARADGDGSQSHRRLGRFGRVLARLGGKGAGTSSGA